MQPRSEQELEQQKRTHSQGQYNKMSEGVKNKEDEEKFLAAARRWLLEQGKPYWKEILDEEQKEKPDSSGPGLSSPGNPDLLKDGYYEDEAGKSVVKLDGNTAKPVKIKDFEKDYGLAMDLLAYRGAETICINYGSPGDVNLKDLKKLMDIAEKKGLGVEFDANVKEHLAGLSQKERDAIMDRLKQVNDKAQSVREGRKSAENERKLEKEVAQEVGKYEEFETLSTTINKETSKAPLRPLPLQPTDPGAVIDRLAAELGDIDRRLQQVEDARMKLDSHLDACDKLLNGNADLGKLGAEGNEGRRNALLNVMNVECEDLKKRQGMLNGQLQTLEGRIRTEQENLVMPTDPNGKAAKMSEYKTQLNKITGLQKQQAEMNKRLGNEGTALTDTKDKNKKVTEDMQAKQEQQAVKRQPG